MSDIKPNCGLCGETMPDGEEMFVYHGYSGPCPKPVLPKPQGMTPQETQRRADCYPELVGAVQWAKERAQGITPDKNTSTPEQIQKENGDYWICLCAALAKAGVS